MLHDMFSSGGNKTAVLQAKIADLKILITERKKVVGNHILKTSCWNNSAVFLSQVIRF